MTPYPQAIEELIKQLPVEYYEQVRDFVTFLLEKNRKQRGHGKLRQDWAGGLRDYRDRYTSLDLQKKALAWRGD